MSELAPLLTPNTPLPPGGGLPRHLYGTRAALFYLLRETAEPDGLAPPAALAPPPPVVVHALPQVARVVVPILPEPARPSLRDLLQSDSFDFRALGDPG